MARRIDQSRGDTQGPVFHGLLNERLHLLQFFVGGFAIDVTEDGFAHLRGSYIGADIQRRSLPLETLVIFVERGPIDGDVIMLERRFEFDECFFVLRRDGSSFSSYFRRNALRKLAQGTIINKERFFRLPQHVDKTRRHYQASCIYLPAGMSVFEFPNRGNAVSANADIPPGPRAS